MFTPIVYQYSTVINHFNVYLRIYVYYYLAAENREPIPRHGACNDVPRPTVGEYRQKQCLVEQRLDENDITAFSRSVRQTSTKMFVTRFPVRRWSYFQMSPAALPKNVTAERWPHLISCNILETYAASVGRVHLCGIRRARSRTTRRRLFIKIIINATIYARQSSLEECNNNNAYRRRRRRFESTRSGATGWKWRQGEISKEQVRGANVDIRKFGIGIRLLC